MINLLPQDNRKNIRAGRFNIILVRYIWLFSIIGVLVLASVSAGVYLVAAEKIRYDDDITRVTGENQALKNVKAQATDFAQNLKLAKTILGNSRSTVDFVSQITAAIPNGVVLDSLVIDNSSAVTQVAQPITFSFRARTLDNVTALKTAMQNSPLFDKVNIVQATVNPEVEGVYKVTASVSTIIKPLAAKGSTP